MVAGVPMEAGGAIAIAIGRDAVPEAVAVAVAAATAPRATWT